MIQIRKTIGLVVFCISMSAISARAETPPLPEKAPVLEQPQKVLKIQVGGHWYTDPKQVYSTFSLAGRWYTRMDGQPVYLHLVRRPSYKGAPRGLYRGTVRSTQPTKVTTGNVVRYSQQEDIEWWMLRNGVFCVRLANGAEQRCARKVFKVKPGTLAVVYRDPLNGRELATTFRRR